MFYSLIVVRLILSLRRNSSLIIWVSLEVNILRFLPIMSSNDAAPFENTMKYFLVQSLASILFIITTIIRAYKYKYRIERVLILSIVLKLGIAPFHSWFIIVIKVTSLHNLFLLSTLQKFIPLVIIRSLNIKFNLVLSLFILNRFIVCASGMETLSIMKILGFSSINNLIWIILALISGTKIFVFFIIIYIYMLAGLLFFNPLKINFRFLQTYKLYDKFLLIFVFFSLGGLPPFIGFMIKAMVIKKSILILRLVIFIPVVIRSLVILYIYISYSFLNITLSSPSINSINSYYYSPAKVTYFLRSLGLRIVIILPL